MECALKVFPFVFVRDVFFAHWQRTNQPSILFRWATHTQFRCHFLSVCFSMGGSYPCVAQTGLITPIIPNCFVTNNIEKTSVLKHTTDEKTLCTRLCCKNAQKGMWETTKIPESWRIVCWSDCKRKRCCFKLNEQNGHAFVWDGCEPN